MTKAALIFFTIYGSVTGAAIRYVVEHERLKTAAILVQLSIGELCGLNVRQI